MNGLSRGYMEHNPFGVAECFCEACLEERSDGRQPSKVPRSGFIQEVKKVWGDEFWVVNTERYCMKFLYIKPGGCSSLHYHRQKDETFFVDEGECFLEIGEWTHELVPGDSFRIPPGTVHRFWVSPRADGKGCMIIEVSTHHDDEDVVRLEESKTLYDGRKQKEEG